MATKQVFGFGCEDAQIFQVGTPPTYMDIPGIQEAEFTLEVDKTDVLGDDDVLTTWCHGPKATVALKAAVIDLDVLGAITGNTVSSGTGLYSIPIGTQDDLAPPEVGLRLQLKGRGYGDSSLQKIKLYIYRVIFSPPKFSGIRGGEALGLELEGMAYTSTRDEMGNPLDKPARARFEIVEV